MPYLFFLPSVLLLMFRVPSQRQIGDVLLCILLRRRIINPLILILIWFSQEISKIFLPIALCHTGFIYLTIYLFICLVASLIQILAIQKIIFFQELLCMYLLYNDVSDYVLRMEKSIFNMVFGDYYLWLYIIYILNSLYHNFSNIFHYRIY